tara:strand:+ start:89 stop:778 length:690 start_codon:yes stop_codon:yes gene_type:complete
MKKIKPICIIPARSGSRRIKNKNIIKISNKPLIVHAIKLAISSKIFSKVVVTTDDEKIAKLSQKNGAYVPFLRSKKLALPSTTIKSTIENCIKTIKSQKIEYHFCLYPSSILINKNDLKKGFTKIKKIKADLLIAVTENENFYRSLVENKSKKNIEFKWKKFQKTMSQNLPISFQDSGTFFIFKTEKYMRSKSIIPKNTTPFVLDKYKGIDLNTDSDLKILKLAYRLFN